jgi:beta-phosphoglucomutase
MAEYEASEPWEVLATMRRAIYDEMVADPQVVRDNQWPHTVELLRVARENNCKTGLATLSARTEALHFVRALGLEKALDVILAREDVAKGKPDPEIYLLAAQRLEVPPQECLVIEDSPNGVRAGLAAGMNVVAFGTPFTIASLHSTQVIDHQWILHDPETLIEVVRGRVAEYNRTAQM